MKNKTLLNIDLHLFDGAAAGGAAGGAAAAGGEGAANVAAATEANADMGNQKAGRNRRNGSSRRSTSGDLSNVVYGKQAEEAAPTVEATTVPAAEGERKSGVSTTSDTLEARRLKYDELINSEEYRQIDQERFQQVFNRRFKEVKGMEETIASHQPIIDMLMQKYNIADGDVKKLEAAINNDDTYWEQAAEEAGLTVEQYKAMQKLERENAALQKMQRRQDAENRAKQKLSTWYKEAEELKQIYPQFDLNKETANRQFLGLLEANIPVRQAYELIHMEEIKEASAKAAAQAAAQQVTANVKARAARPSENGTSSQSASLIKNDVSNLTRADRAEIARRARRGEKITF